MRQLERNQILRKVKRFYRSSSRHDRDLFLSIPKSRMNGLYSLYENDLVRRYSILYMLVIDFMRKRNFSLLSRQMSRDIEGNHNPSMRFRNISNIHIVGHQLGFSLAETVIALKKIKLDQNTGIPIDFIIIDECKNMKPKMESLPPISEIISLKNMYHLSGTYLIDHKKQPKLKEIDQKHRYNHAIHRKK